VRRRRSATAFGDALKRLTEEAIAASLAEIAAEFELRFGSREGEVK